MAIIDRKLSEDAQRQAREYAQRNDTAATHDWQQPPPAYEEAPTSSSSSSSVPRGSLQPRSDGREVEEGESSRPRRSRRRQSQEEELLDTISDDSDESTPLLTDRHNQLIKKKLKLRRKIRKSCHFLLASACLSSVVLLVMKYAGMLEKSTQLPAPNESDGHPIEDPTWSTPVKTKPNLWTNPYIPLYSSSSTFSFSPSNEFFLHADGTSYSGQASIVNGDSVSDGDYYGVELPDLTELVFVIVEARFTEISLRDGIRVNKMRMNSHKEGVGVYGTNEDHGSRSLFLSMHVSIILPSGRLRKPSGRAKDNSSFIPEVDIALDNMRLAIEQLHLPDGRTDKSNYVTLGKLKSTQLNGAVSLLNGLVANESVSLSLQNGEIRDIVWAPHVPSILSPHININIVNGPIWLNKLVAKESIELTTANGGSNVTSVAISKSIKIKHDTGVMGGTYRANELELNDGSGGILVDVDLRRDIFDGEFVSLEQQELDASRHSNKSKCRQMNVIVKSELGEIQVNYKNHQPGVLLSSTISSSAGEVGVAHDAGFEGYFEARNQLGSIELHSPHVVIIEPTLPEENKIDEPEQGLRHRASNSEEKSKQFVIVTDDRGQYGKKQVIGKTWWNDHDWEDKKSFCESRSMAKSELGRLLMDFR